MHCISYVATAASMFVGAQAIQLGGQAEGHGWLKTATSSGHMNCSVTDGCVVGSGVGACFLEVDPAVPAEVGPTDAGSEVSMIRRGAAEPYPGPPRTLRSEDITMIGHTESSHWNLCWKPDKAAQRKALTDPPPDVADYCYYVNGVCFLWASPCSGGCSNISLTGYPSFCPTLRYATEAEFSAFDGVVGITYTAGVTPQAKVMERAAFFQKCASGVFDPLWAHCDFSNEFVRLPDNHWNEQVLVCGSTPSPTPSPPTPTAPPTGSISATGDPHLQNVHGERFDLMKPGKHVLIQIPKGGPAEDALLRVQADARRLGGQCEDLYFQELNVTGAWVEAKHTGGLHFQARDQVYEKPSWEKFGKVQIKVAHGITNNGARYLNFYVKHLGHAGFGVGGLLGEDDHKEAAKSPAACAHRTSLLQVAAPSDQSVSVAEASFA